MPLDLHEVSGLPETLAELRAEIEALRAENGSGWLRGSDAIGRYVGLSGAAIRRRKQLGEDIPVRRQGGALIASKAELDAWMRTARAR